MTAKFCVFAKQNTERSEVNKIRTKQRNEVKLIVLFHDVATSMPSTGSQKKRIHIYDCDCTVTFNFGETCWLCICYINACFYVGKIIMKTAP